VQLTQLNSNKNCVIAVQDQGRSLVDMERDALATLMALNAERDEVESRITRESKSDRAVAERHFSEKIDSLDRAYEESKRNEMQAYRKRRDETEADLNQQYKTNEKAYQGERLRINERADHDETATKRAWEEARWSAETVYDAKAPQPKDDFLKTERALRVRLMTANSIEDSARDYLRRFWIRRIPAAAETIDIQVVIRQATSEEKAPAQLEALMKRAGELAGRLRRTFVARLMEGMNPFFFFLLPFVASAAIFGSLTDWQFNDFSLIPWLAGGAALIGVLGVCAMLVLARKQLIARFMPLRDTVAAAKMVRERCLILASEKRAREEAELKRIRDEDVAKAEARYAPQLERIAAVRTRLIADLDADSTERLRGIEQERDSQLADIDVAHTARMKEIDRAHHRASATLQSEKQARLATIDAQYRDAWDALEAKWKSGMASIYSAVRIVNQLDEERFPQWTDDIWHIWKPPSDFTPAVRFGEFAIDFERLPGGVPSDPRLLEVGPLRFTVPALLDFPSRTSLLVEAAGEGRNRAVPILQNVMLRLLTSFPPGKIRFTIVDPVGLGQNFAAFMHLADYEEAFVSDRIWTETRHIEQRLLDLTEHMENVIQKYLRNDFATITEYNEHAGEIAEPFRFLVIANFPVNFSDTAARRLVSIVDSGARCGVYTLISMDRRHQMPQGFHPEDLRRGCTYLTIEPAPRDSAVSSNGSRSADEKPFDIVWKDEVFGRLPLSVDEPPDDDFLTQTLHVVGESAKDSTRVEVPFEHVMPANDEIWSFSAAKELSVPLGRAGATKLQSLALGRGMAQHVLIAGKTGSGKSTLLHVLVTNLSLCFRPDEVEFYLVDFKKGVEFKTYATHNLPHARAVAIESDREFGLSVLQRVDNELRRRGEIFRRLGVQDLAGYRETGSSERIPRTLLIIDEFQEFFVEDDKISQDAALLLDRLVRQGRAFGIHVILGSQTLGGAYSLARATIGQMAVRIALQCSENDAMLIMGDDNTAPRLLSRPGEAIYNDQGGLVEGNNPFQIVWLPDRVRDAALTRVQELVAELNYQPPEPQIVFEGNVPAAIERNQPLRRALHDRTQLPKAPRAWLGDAIAIKDPTSAIFRRQSGNNLLIVGQRDEAALAMAAIGLVSLAAQSSVDTARFYILDSTPEDDIHAHYLQRVADHLPHDICLVPWRGVEQAMSEIGQVLEQRQSQNVTDGAPIFLFIHGLQKFRMLRTTDEFGFGMSDGDKPKTADKHLAELLRDGPPHGMHAIIWCDTASNLSRTLDRGALREFDQRVLFQMSGVDSSTLIDTPIASVLGQNRAIYFSEDQGILEKFRPYALPDPRWVAEVDRAFTAAR